MSSFGGKFLELLSKFGNVVIMDKEEGDYMITVSPVNIAFVRNLLDYELGTNNYEMTYKPEFVNYEIDFNVAGKTSEKK